MLSKILGHKSAWAARNPNRSVSYFVRYRQEFLWSGSILSTIKIRHPEVRKRASVFFSLRVGPKDLVLIIINVNWIDFFLNVGLLAVVPFVLAAYGGHLAAETIADVKSRRRAKTWFWSLGVVGIAIAAISQYRSGQTEEIRNKLARESEVRTAVAEREARQSQTELADSEKANTKKLLDLQGQINKLLMRPQPVEQKIDELKLRNEIAAAVADKVKPQTAPLQPQTQAVQNTTVQTRPCRGDTLHECTDEQLLEWGKPLVANIEAIVDEHSTDVKKLDDIKGGNWLGALVGIGDKSSKWLKGYAQADDKAIDRFRSCCAENALSYHKELAQRLGGGKENNSLYDWMRDVAKPKQSKEYKKAAQNDNVLEVQIDLHTLQFDLQIKGIKGRKNRD